VDLGARIDAELRARIEDAVDYACLDAMVRARTARGERAPAAEDPTDRAEYVARVTAFLDELRGTLEGRLDAESRARLAPVLDHATTDIAAALDAQVALAKELPDYWQRFLEVRDPEPASGRERRGLFRRLLGR
jgi:hypothetical protein